MNIKEEIQGFSISDKSCCLIGCGGLGCNISVHLAGAGIGRIYVCDFDTVSKSNLNRQFLYTLNDVGKKKCFVMKDRLSTYAPECDIIAVNKKIQSTDDLKFCEDCDIIICALDNPNARRIIQKYCEKNEKPLATGGIDGFYGMAYLYIPKISPLPSNAGMDSGAKARLSISASAGIIGAIEASLSIQYLLSGNDELAGKIIIYDGSTFDTLPLKGV